MISGIGDGGGYSTGPSIANIQAEMTAKFHEFDVNGDGALAKSELSAGVAKEGHSVERAEAMFDLADTDGDGVVTQTEHEAGMEMIAKGGHGRPPGPPPIDQSNLDLTSLLLQSLQSQDDESSTSSAMQLLLEELGVSST